VLARLGDQCNSEVQEIRVVNCIVLRYCTKLNTTIYKGLLSTSYILTYAVVASFALAEQRDRRERLLSCSRCATEIRGSERAYRQTKQPCCRISLRRTCAAYLRFCRALLLPSLRESDLCHRGLVYHRS
jgi:hypothetical protein